MKQHRPPHIVIFNPDQWRWDVLGHMGNPAAVTPNLDAAVRTDAVSFRRAFCQGTVCTPSRCSFMTGWYPHVAGHRTMFHMLHPHEPLLLRRLKQEGYFVFWAGKNDLTPGQLPFHDVCDVRLAPGKQPPGKRPPDLHVSPSWRGEPGSDTYYSFYAGKLTVPPGHSHYPDHDWACVEAAIDFLRNAPKDKPLCMFLSLGYPHPPYGVEDPWYSAIDRSKLPPRIPAPADDANKPSMLAGIRRRQGMQGWTEDRWTELRSTYYGMCARVDAQYGLLMDALRRAGIYDDTAVFLFSDHGDFTGDYGLVEKNQNTFEDCLTRVPFIIKPPKWQKVRPRVSEALVELIDFPATVAALAGISPRHTHFGRSLLPVIAGDGPDELRDAVFCEGGRLHGERHCMELESSSSQVPTGLYWPRVNLQQSEGPEHTKAVMCRTRDFKYVRRLYEQDELYDLRNDPAEEHNLIEDASLALERAQLQHRMLTWFVETADAVPFDTDKR